MRTPAEVLENHRDLALYWTGAIQRRHEMQMPIPHDPLEVRSLTYGAVIRNLYFALKQSVATVAAHEENEGDECPLCQLEAKIETLVERSNSAMTRAVKAEADLEEYKEGIEIERQWKREAYDRNTKLKEVVINLADRLDLWSEDYHKLKAKSEILQNAVLTHAMRFNDAAMVRCYYCIFCGAELGMGSIEHKEDCVVLLGVK